MLRILFVCFALASVVQAQKLDEIISYALKCHNSLKSIEQKLSILDESLELSRNFTNPEVVLSISDIQFAEPLNSSLEPMQFQSLSVKQKIPYFGKRDADTSLIHSQKKLLFSSLQEAQIALSKEIKLTAYTIWEYEKKLHITDEYIKLNKKNTQLSSVYSESGQAWHVETMSIELELTQLKIKRSSLKSSLDSLFKRLSYLASKEIQSVEVDVEVRQPKSLQEYMHELQNNKTYQKKLAEVEEKRSRVRVEELGGTIDPVVQVGYYHREAFNDYMSVSVGASLPLYGSEALKTQRARKEVLQTSTLSSDFYERLKADLGEAHAKLSNDYAIYTILSQESIPQIEHMLALRADMIKRGNGLLLYTQLLEKKLSLDEQMISVEASYKRDLSSLEALLGETK